MTQKTKLEIIGPYTPEHEGPYGWGNSKVLPCTVHSVVKGWAFVSTKYVCRPFCTEIENIHNAREVPVPREFWVNEYHGGNLVVYDSPEKAQEFQVCLKRTIHVREVLPGETA
ncbi:hypothetical protein [Acetobacter sp. P5B1]|uniref:hypothetical protein n=1 Tax=Acetobacter sp. P5B1 TaxID=2762620 RepID=UPI001C05799F|nr:hypothetical protein [Acetobacter sp. P5B1]